MDRPGVALTGVPGVRTHNELRSLAERHFNQGQPQFKWLRFVKSGCFVITDYHNRPNGIIFLDFEKKSSFSNYSKIMFCVSS